MSNFENLERVYSAGPYIQTDMITHNGTVVAFAMNDTGAIHYTVLDLSNSRAKATDAANWLPNPQPLPFPSEIALANWGIDNEVLPLVDTRGVVRSREEAVPENEIDSFRSSTASLSDKVGFQVLSDGAHIYLFRQSRAKTEGEVEAGVDWNPQEVLMDRFVLVGTTLSPKREIRFRRSRHKSRPQGPRDSLGSSDMDKVPFVEPTLVLDFLGEIREGKFCVLLVPTSVAEVMRWQFFLAGPNDTILAINVARARSGLFDMRGSDHVLGDRPTPDGEEHAPEITPKSGETRFSFNLGQPMLAAPRAVLYHEQELASHGHGNRTDPYKRQTRILRAATLAENAEGEGRVAVVDFAVSAAGQLSQLKGDVTLPRLERNDPLLAKLAERAETEAALTAARHKVEGLNNEIAALQQTYDTEINTLSRARSDLQRSAGDLGNLLRSAQNRRARVIFYTHDDKNAGTNAMVTLSLFDKDENQIGEFYYGTQFNKNIAPHESNRQQIRFVEEVGHVNSEESRRRKAEFSDPAKRAGWNPFERGTIDTFSADLPVKQPVKIRVGINRDGTVQDRNLSKVRYVVTENGTTIEDITFEVNSVFDVNQHDKFNASEPIKPVTYAEGYRVQLAEQKAKLDSATSVLNLKTAEKTQALADTTSRLQKARAALEALQDKTATVGDAQVSAVGEQLGLVAVDPEGFTVQGGVLGFAATIDAPTLHQSARGEVGLYFRGETGVFSGAYFQTLTDRAQFTLPTSDKTPMMLEARASGEYLNALEITIEPARSGAESCTLTLSNSSPALTEVWHEMPRATGAMAEVLNGQSGSRRFAGTLAQAMVAGASVDTLTLTGGLREPCPAGAQIVLDGDVLLHPAAPAHKGDTTISVMRAELEQDVAERARIDILPYNYRAHVTRDTHASDAFVGSLLVRAAAPEGDALVKDGTSGAEITCEPAEDLGGWMGHQPGRSLEFDGTASLVPRGGAAAAGFDIAADVTLEAWVNPVTPDSAMPVLQAPAGPAGRNYGLAILGVSAHQTGFFFDGKSSTLSVERDEASRPGLLPKTGATFEFLVKFRADTKNCCLFRNATGFALYAYPASGRICFTVRVKDEVLELFVTHKDLYDQTWHHIAATYDGKIQRLYLDGREIDSKKPDQPGHIDYDDGLITVGADYNVGVPGYKMLQLFRGEMAELRLWNRALTAQQVGHVMFSQISSEAAGLAAYWAAGDGKRVEDLTSHGFSGEMQGAVVPVPSPVRTAAVAARVGDVVRKTPAMLRIDRWSHVAASYRQTYALRLDGGDDYLECTDSQALDITGDLTLEIFLCSRVLKDAGLISKGREGAGQPYALALREDGGLQFSYEDKSGSRLSFASPAGMVVPGKVQRIAVTRSIVTESHKPIPEGHDVSGVALDEVGSNADGIDNATRAEYVTGQKQAHDAGNNTATEPKTTDSSVVVNRTEIKIWVDGKAVMSKALSGRFDGTESIASLKIGRSPALDVPAGFDGDICEVRIWNTVLGHNALCTTLNGREKGLVAWWPMNENTGHIAYDAKGENHVTLIGTAWVQNPDTSASPLTILINGETVNTETADWPCATPETFEIGPGYQGTLEEVRIWSEFRSAEAISDTLFGRLVETPRSLVAYYPFDVPGTSKDTVMDRGSGANDLTMRGSPGWLLSTAPISDDIAQVRSVLTGVATAFHANISAPAVVQEYGDMQSGADGMLSGALKRVYSVVDNGNNWRLWTGYKVGTLITEWVSQVQSDPQIIGFVEGAPPVPSENLTGAVMLGGKRRVKDYQGLSSVELIEAENVRYLYSSSKEDSHTVSVKGQIGAGVKEDTKVGMGIEKSAAAIEVNVSAKLGIDTKTGQMHAGTATQGRNQTRSSKLTLQGEWEDPSNKAKFNPIGQRYIPRNLGYALVQSDTMDVYALRMKESRALVTYRMMPNPDIPKDWNIISFPINARYIKQGVLDGKVGLVPDVDFPNAARSSSSHASYFKPVEAYALKARIERERQELQTYFDKYSTNPNLLKSGKTPLLPDATTNLVNTYVWTADGGFFAETTSQMDAVSESHTGTFGLTHQEGMSVKSKFAIFGVAVNWELEMMHTQNLTVTKSRASTQEHSFAINLTANPDNNLQAYSFDADDPGPRYDPQGRPILVPGKVNAYRFMTFYLEPSQDHFEDFFNTVVDQTWLNESSDPNALALMQAKQQGRKPACWRILHRVTFVSRIPEKTGTAGGLAMQMQDVDLSSNWELIKRLDPQVKAGRGSYADLKGKVAQALKDTLPSLSDHQDEIVDIMASYYGLPTCV